MLGRSEPYEDQILGNESGYASYKSAKKELEYQEEWCGQKDLVIVEVGETFYVCYGEDHKNAYTDFLPSYMQCEATNQ
jgi:hypothetical protein